MNWWGSLDGLLLSTGNDAIVLETDVETFVRASNPEPSPKTEADLIALDCVDETGMPPPSLGCLHRLYEDFVADQHTWTLLRQTGDRKASASISTRPRSKGRIQTNERGTDIRF